MITLKSAREIEAMDRAGLPTRFACIGEVLAFSEKNIIVD